MRTHNSSLASMACDQNLENPSTENSRPGTTNRFKARKAGTTSRCRFIMSSLPARRRHHTTGASLRWLVTGTWIIPRLRIQGQQRREDDLTLAMSAPGQPLYVFSFADLAYLPPYCRPTYIFSKLPSHRRADHRS